MAARGGRVWPAGDTALCANRRPRPCGGEERVDGTLEQRAGRGSNHWDGILRWYDSKIANGLIEGINSLVQAAKAKARGYRSIRNLKAIVYLIAGKLDLQLPA